MKEKASEESIQGDAASEDVDGNKDEETGNKDNVENTNEETDEHQDVENTNKEGKTQQEEEDRDEENVEEEERSEKEDKPDSENETETASVKDEENRAMGETFIIIPGAQGKSYQVRSYKQSIMDCGICFSKYLLCLFNFIILVAGTGVLVFGVWLYADKESLLSVANAIDDKALPQLEFFTEPEMSANISYILMAVGGAMFILSILGYCGALRESRCLLGFYGALLVLILVLEITAAGMAYFYKDKAEDEVRTLLKSTITSYYSPENAKENSQTQFFNLIMTKMHCCGVDDFNDFKDSPKFNQSGLVVPPACCFFQDINGNMTLLDPDCPKSPKPENSYFMTGCYNAIMLQIKDHMDIVIYVIIGLVAIELLATFLAFCLCKSLQPFDK